MSEHPERGFTFDLNRTASSACVVALLAAAQVATEMVAFPDRVKVDDVSPLARLEYATQEMKRAVKNLFTEGMSEQDEADGFRTALALIDDNAVAIRKRIR